MPVIRLIGKSYVKPSDEIFKNVAHIHIGDGVGVKIDMGDFFKHLKQSIGFLEARLSGSPLSFSYSALVTGGVVVFYG